MGDMLTQEEINALLAGGDIGGASDPEPEAAPADAAPAGGGDSGGMLSQDEINALLAGGMDGDAPPPAPAPAADSGGGGDSGGMLSQDEINALLAGGMDGDAAPAAASTANFDDVLSADDKDVLGEVGNISMGTAATTLFTLLNNKVLITTPKVTVTDWKTQTQSYDRPCVGIKVSYTEGITGSNILILKEHDVKIITDLMMGGTGAIEENPAPLTELELSAIGEAMNQMIGSSSTSLSSVINRKIDIDTPQAMTLDFGDNQFFEEKVGFAPDDVLACIAFRMEIGDLIDSEITQIIPIEFARDMVNKMMENLMPPEEPAAAAPAAAAPAPAPAAAAPAMAPPPGPAAAPAPAPGAPPPSPAAAYPPPGVPPGYPPPGYPPPMPGQEMAPAAYYYPPEPRQPVVYPAQGLPQTVGQPAQFQALDMTELAQQKENIGIIMDVPLEVTVELGRTSRKIREILEFTPGTIVDLDKLAGEPIDILVNGKFVATGEVVVVDENFAVRVVDIVNVDKRI